DGCQRIELRVLISITGAVFLLVLTWILVPEHGLVGLAWAQIGQGILILLGSWVLLQRELPSLTLLSPKWRYTLFREMFQYGFNFQVVSVAVMLFDPITKVLMATFGGLSSTAYYEMASRMVMKFHALLVSANQVLVPQVANLNETAPDEIRKIYRNSYRIVFFLSLPLFAGVAAIAPLASELWIGHYEQSFVEYSLLLTAGYWLNTLIGPAYFVNLGTGSLRLNTLSHLAIGILNGVFGYLLGLVFGDVGVVSGHVLALVTGSCLLILGFHRDQHMPLAGLFPAEDKFLFFSCCLGLLMGWWTFRSLEDSLVPIVNAGLTLAACTIPTGIAFWLHPMRRKIVSRIVAEIGRRASIASL
ncbi:MAG: hypothetical protein EXR85_09455, partial [Xanthomonadales bacterium]|nr:hypothetical protein [Xanthomonadales bacterium]